MKTLLRYRKKIALLVGLFAAVIVTSGLVSYWASTARALSVPKTTPLFYSGLLTDGSGKPLTATSAIVGLDIYDLQTGGNSKCSMAPASAQLTQGRFRIALSSTCVTVLQDNPDLWIEVTVGAAAMGRTKIGAMPYVLAPDTLKVAGDASFTIHSNTDTPTSGSKMLSLKTGKTSPADVFNVDSKGYVGLGSIGTSPSAMLNIVQSSNTDWAASIYNGGGSGKGLVVKSGGSIPIPALQVGDIAGNVRLLVQSTGNVGIGTTSPAATLDVSGTVKATGDITTTPWTDWSPSWVTGWASFSQKYIRYKLVGKLCFVTYSIGGTSNSAVTEFPLPYPIGFDQSVYLSGGGETIDNSAEENGHRILLIKNNNTALFYRTAPNYAFTASGTKRVDGQFYYEIK